MRHEVIEKSVNLMMVLIVLAVSIGGLVEIVPLMLSSDVTEPAEGIEPYPNKIVRGLGNGLLGVVEIPGQIIKGADDGNVILGVVKGFWFAASRTQYGLNETFGFLFPNPPDTRGYAFEQEWPWDALAGSAD